MECYNIIYKSMNMFINYTLHIYLVKSYMYYDISIMFITWIGFYLV